MPVTPIGITVGTPGNFLAIPNPVGAILPAGVVPQWTSSNVLIATVANPNPDPTGLTTQLTGLETGTITLTVSATLPNGNVAQGSVQVPVVAGQVTSFTITQTS